MKGVREKMSLNVPSWVESEVGVEVVNRDSRGFLRETAMSGWDEDVSLSRQTNRRTEALDWSMDQWPPMLSLRLETWDRFRLAI